MTTKVPDRKMHFRCPYRMCQRLMQYVFKKKIIQTNSDLKKNKNNSKYLAHLSSFFLFRSLKVS